MIKSIITQLTMLLLIASTFFTQATFAHEDEETPVISQQALIKAMKNAQSDIIVLDVRTEGEFAQGHIKGAINMSHNLIEENIAALSQYKNKTVVVHCRSGYRAGIAEHILADNGFTKLRHLEGDMKAWVAADLPVVSSK